MRKTAVNRYLKELSGQLCCSTQEKRKILLIFKTRLIEFKSEHTQMLQYEDIVKQFGTPKEVADIFLSEYTSTQLHNLVKHNRTKRFFIIAICVLVFAVLFIYSSLKIQQFHWFQNGYIVQVTYPGTDPHLDELGVTNWQTY